MPIFDCHTYLTVTSLSGSMRSRDQVLATMERFGLDAVALISGLGASCDFVTGNKMLREVVDEEYGLYAYTTLNVNYPDECLQEQRLYLGKREFVGSILVTEPGKFVGVKQSRDIVNGLRRYSKPVAIFTPDEEAVAVAREIAEEFTQIKFIFLCMGGDAWRFAVEAAKKLLNINLEISGSLDAEKVTFAATTISSKRLLFGSGLPNGDPSLFQGLVEDSTVLTKTDRSRLLLDNALTLFHINADVE